MPSTGAEPPRASFVERFARANRPSARIVGLGGGVGASCLWRALAAAVPATALTLVVNTGDDLWIHGLRVCPDLDTTLYALSGRQDTDRRWGLRSESFRAMNALRDLGQEVWFNLADHDLAVMPRHVVEA